MLDFPSAERRRPLGQSGLEVSPVALGCWPIAGMTSLHVNDADSRRTLMAAVESGINFLDTAHCYGANGESELLIGEVFGDSTEELVVATKGGIHWDSQGQRHVDGHPQTLRRQCELSLKRLRRPVLDLYYLHTPDPQIPLSESAGALHELQRAGKIRGVGLSNVTLAQAQEFAAVCPLDALQPPLNLLQPAEYQELAPWCRQQGISLITYWPLMKGLLAGKIRRGHAFDPADKRLTYEIFQQPAFERAQQLLDGLDAIATATGKSVAQLVVNWTAHQPGVTSVLCGAKRAWQIKETAGALGWQLTPDQREAIERLAAAAR